MYVTRDRIIVNKGRGQLSLRAHFLIALLALFAPAVPAILAIAILLTIATIIALLLAKKRFRRKWPTIEAVEKGRRQLEVRRGEVLTIELKPPRKLRSGLIVITSLSNEPFNLKILGEKVFKMARDLLVRFEPSRVRMVESQSGSTQLRRE